MQGHALSIIKACYKRLVLSQFHCGMHRTHSRAISYWYKARVIVNFSCKLKDTSLKQVIASQSLITNRRLTASSGIQARSKSGNSSMATTLDASKLTRPDWAKGYDTPYFVVHEKTEDYELREYEETKWALTDIEKTEGQWESYSGTRAPFFKLFKYITGNNASSKKIPMTVPVRMEHTPKKVDMAFMVPHDVKDDAPDPTASDVKIVTVPRQLVYVRTFGGYPRGFFGNKNYWNDELDKLRASLTRDGKKFEAEKFFTTGYDSPWKFYDRHNEVWITKIED